jgi:protein-tyrosine-phosphatase
MAETIARTLGGDRVDVNSAGLAPTGWIAERTCATLATLGYPSAGLFSKGFDRVDRENLDVVVSLLGERGFQFLPPDIPGQRKAWEIRDPFGEDEEVYLEVARELEVRIRRLLADRESSELLGP